jgi:hypothetical protein
LTRSVNGAMGAEHSARLPTCELHVDWCTHPGPVPGHG